MIKSSNKKRFKRDIHILKIQRNSKYCKQHGDSNREDCYIFSPISTALQKGKISSLFLPKLNWQYGIFKMVPLSIRRLRELNLCGFFEFGVISPNMESRPQFTPKRVKISILSLPKFYWQKDISKKVSSCIRRLRELNLYIFF